MNYKEIMPNDKIIAMINDIHNKWWNRVKDFNEGTDKKQADTYITNLLDHVKAEFSDNPLAWKVAEAYIDKLEARVKGGYKDFEGERERMDK
jgi:hypothetical protein|nr:MAG TPA: hypothetical protein [Caudoviricetes sp.]